MYVYVHISQASTLEKLAEKEKRGEEVRAKKKASLKEDQTEKEETTD